MSEKKTKNFIFCPACQAKSKKLRSEMDGLQTRQCKNGHIFTYDKWIMILSPPAGDQR